MPEDLIYVNKRTPRDRPPVDIVIPFRGQYEVFTRCYSAIMNYTPNQKFRVFLVDDCSSNTDFLQSFLEGRKKTFGTRPPNPVGFGAAVNAGIRLGDSPLVCVMHSDIIVDNIYWLYHLQEALGIGKSKGIKFVSSRLNDPGTANDYPPELLVNCKVGEDLVIEATRPVPWTCCLFHRDLMGKIGYLKEYPLAWYEDIEYYHRMKNKCFKQGIATHSTVHHVGGKTIKAMISEKPSLLKTMEEKYVFLQKGFKQVKAGIILAVHDRIDDLDVHLDILDFYPEIQKIIVYSHPEIPSHYLERWRQRAIINEIDGNNFSIGPLLALTCGLKLSENLDYVIYRNADDWLFNHESVQSRLQAMQNGNFLFAGYNWVSHGTMREFALNEVTFHVNTFLPYIDRMEESFKNSSVHLLCEFKLARWINRIIDSNSFLRLSDRERPPGVGHDLSTLEFAAGAKKIKLPERWQEKWANNHRFFHRQWQLIGSHSQKERYLYYKKIRDEIKYCHELEAKSEFRRWLLAARNGLPWNLPTASSHVGGRKIPADMAKPAVKIPPFSLPVNMSQ